MLQSDYGTPVISCLAEEILGPEPSRRMGSQAPAWERWPRCGDRFIAQPRYHSFPFGISGRQPSWISTAAAAPGRPGKTEALCRHAITARRSIARIRRALQEICPEVGAKFRAARGDPGRPGGSGRCARDRLQHTQAIRQVLIWVGPGGWVSLLDQAARLSNPSRALTGSRQQEHPRAGPASPVPLAPASLVGGRSSPGKAALVP